MLTLNFTLRRPLATDLAIVNSAVLIIHFALEAEGTVLAISYMRASGRTDRELKESSPAQRNEWIRICCAVEILLL